MDKILLVKTSALGDIIHIYPVVDYLRSKFPQAQIDWVVEAPFADLVKSHPSINNVLTIASKAWRKALLAGTTYREINEFRKKLRENSYDVVFDLQGNIKSGLVLSQARSKIKVGFDASAVPEKPNLLFTNRRFAPSNYGNIRQDYLSIVAAYFNESLPETTGKVTLKITPEQQKTLRNVIANSPLPNRPNVIVCSGSAWQNKQMTPAALTTFLTLVQRYLDCNLLSVWGSAGERLVAESLHAQFKGTSQIVEKMGLAMLQNLMGMSDLVIAMDSLPLHLAGTTNTPSFSVFGASSGKKYKPLGLVHGAYQGACPYGRTFEKRCPILRSCPTGACIRDLHGNEVFDDFRRHWEDTHVPVS